jgi:hypothetical protein
MASAQTFTYTIIVATMILIVAYYGTKWAKPKLSISDKDDYHAIKQYLLNDSDLFNGHKPNIWVHSKFEYNARKWASFGSRSSMELNQPYIHLTIKSIIEHCENDFHVCLVDDQTFSKLLPDWDIDLSRVSDPLKSRYREIGMCMLVYKYGGMILPNSVLCLKSLIPMYTNGTVDGKPFVCENVNHTSNMLLKHKRALNFIPSTFIFGSHRENPIVQEYIDYLKQKAKVAHFSTEMEFIGDTSDWCMRKINSGNMVLIGGEIVGTKDAKNKPVLVENLMEDQYLKLSRQCLAVHIPEDEILKRTKYSWFAVAPTEELLTQDFAISRLMQSSMYDVIHMKESDKPPPTASAITVSI